ncbi:MAG: hypothetical protein JNN03_16455 [Rubrivivax sp.]|nr:hypothetical protein [Rubrivivax sp.]
MALTHPDTTPRARSATPAYAKCIEASSRVRWDIERDVIRGRTFDTTRKFLPDGLSKVGELGFLSAAEQRRLSQVQGRTYANMFGFIERAIAAKTLELSQSHQFGDQVAFEALVRFTDEELKHQALFRRLEQIAAEGMPPGYAFGPDANAVAQAVLAHSTWAVLGLTLDIEIFTLAHYRSSIEPASTGAAALDPLWTDVFLFHWKEESQHAILDELEWRREHARLDEAGRDRGVTDLISLDGAVDGILVQQATADATYFVQCAGRSFDAAETAAVHDLVLRAYRWQYIVSGVQEPRFAEVMKELVTPAQMQRIGAALGPIVNHVMG